MNLPSFSDDGFSDFMFAFLVYSKRKQYALRGELVFLEGKAVLEELPTLQMYPFPFIHNITS